MTTLERKLDSHLRERAGLDADDKPSKSELRPGIAPFTAGYKQGTEDPEHRCPTSKQVLQYPAVHRILREIPARCAVLGPALSWTGGPN